MEESPSCKTSPTKRKDHHSHADIIEYPIKCTNKRCQSCTAGVIADCVAICCCPCAFLSFFTLAFFKAPYMVGRKFLGLGKKNEILRRHGREFVGGVGASFENKGMEVKSLEIGDGFEDEEKEKAERVWFELYHLGFGRVSFTGV